MHIWKPERNTDIDNKYVFLGDLQSAGQGNIPKWDS